MTTSVSSVIRLALELSPEQRSDLAATLLAGLVAAPAVESPQSVHRQWAIEVEFRIEDARERGEADATWETFRCQEPLRGPQVRLVPAAEGEVRDAIALYRRTRPLLVLLLLEALDEAIERVRRDGESLPRAPKTNPLEHVRRARVAGFPFEVWFHDAEDGDARVLALAHIGQPPST